MWQKFEVAINRAFRPIVIGSRASCAIGGALELAEIPALLPFFAPCCGLHWSDGSAVCWE